jgi:hypothetical protein
MTPTETKICDYVAAQYGEGVCCTVREIKKLISSNSISGTLKILEAMRDQGLVIWEEGKQRTIRPGKFSPPPRQFPLHNLSASTPTLPLPRTKQTVMLDRKLTPDDNRNLVALLVTESATQSPYYSAGDMLLVELVNFKLFDHTRICLYRQEGAIFCFEVIAGSTVKNQLRSKKGNFIEVGDIFGVLVRVYGAPRMTAPKTVR